MVRVRPGTFHLDGSRVGVAGAAHALDDPLREEHPDLLVVVELRMALQRRERGSPGGVVPTRIELEAVPPSEAHVPLGPEVGARPGDREIHVEHDGTKSSSHADGHRSGVISEHTAAARLDNTSLIVNGLRARADDSLPR